MKGSAPIELTRLTKIVPDKSKVFRVCDDRQFHVCRWVKRAGTASQQLRLLLVHMQGALLLSANPHLDLASSKHSFRPPAVKSSSAIRTDHCIFPGRGCGLSAGKSLQFCGSSLCRGLQPQGLVRQRFPEPREGSFELTGAHAGGGAKLAQPVQVPQPGKDGASPAQIFQTALNALDLFDSADEVDNDAGSYEDIAVDQQGAAAAVVGRAVYEVSSLPHQRALSNNTRSS